MGESIDTLIGQLRNFRTRSAAKENLLALGAKAVEPLIGALGDHSEGVRWTAAALRERPARARGVPGSPRP